MEINCVPVHAMKSCWAEEVQIHTLITSTPDGGEWQMLEAMVKNKLNQTATPQYVCMIRTGRNFPTLLLTV